MPAPRVLVDATAVPVDRGGVGRYVDNLLAALDAAGTDLAVGLPARGRRPARPARPGGAAGDRARLRPGRPDGLGADRAAAAGRPGSGRRCCTRRTTRCRCARRCPTVVTVHDMTFFTQPGDHTRVKGPFFRSAVRVALARATRTLAPSAATRDEMVRDPRRRPGPGRRRAARRRPGRVPPADAGGGRPGRGRAGGAAGRVRGVPRHPGAAQERAAPWSAAGRRRSPAGPTRRRWCSPAGPGGTPASSPRWPRCRPACGCCGPATCRWRTCAATWAGRPWWRTRAPARASGCRCWRRWPAGRRC